MKGKGTQVLLNYNQGFKWFVEDKVSYKGYFIDVEDNILSHSDVIKTFEDFNSVDDLKSCVSRFKGMFSIIINHGDNVLFCTDKTRTFPIFYGYLNDVMTITDDAFIFKNEKQVSSLSKKEFLHTGYVTGSDTLLRDVKQSRAGECLRYIGDENIIENSLYTDFKVSREELIDYKNGQDVLHKVLRSTIKRLILSAKGRTIVIPLSGGYDSRVVATLLKEAKYENVICFSYGGNSSIDSSISKLVAQKLGYKWLFVDYDRINFDSSFVETDLFKDYSRFAFNMSSVFLLQDFFAIQHLYDQGLIPKDSIIVPGHSGDFLVGNHLYPFDKVDIAYKKIKNQIISRHFVLQAYKKDKNIEDKIINNLEGNHLSYSIIDNFNMKERQAKFIVNANRVYEFFGYEHRLPLWDEELVEFFRTLPFKQKLNSELYFETIIEKIFKPFDVFIIPPDKHKSRLGRTLKEYIPLGIASKIRNYLHKKNQINTNSGYFRVLKPMIEKYNLSSYQINGILSKWLIKNYFPDN